MSLSLPFLRKILAYIICCAALVVSRPGSGAEPYRAIQTIKLPPGFSISVYATDIKGARMMTLAPNGDVFVAAMGGGQIVLLKADKNGDGKPDGRATYLEKLARPHSMIVHGGYLYFTEETRVSRVPYSPDKDAPAGDKQVLLERLPTGGHITKTIGFDDAGKMYVSIGSSCNVCAENDKRRATIMQYSADGKDERIYASGSRNAVGFAWHPRTRALFATENGRDLLGDDFPPDELNLIKDGGFYGWPYANGDKVTDPDYGAGHEKDIARTIPPVVKFQAHSAALGICFYDPPTTAAHAFPAEYRGDAFVCFHGSWNRSKKTGYKVVRVPFGGGDMPKGYEDFAAGWLGDGDSVSGRVVGPLVAADGSLLISDDFNNCVYRISYTKPK